MKEKQNLEDEYAKFLEKKILPFEPVGFFLCPESLIINRIGFFKSFFCGIDKSSIIIEFVVKF